jgi:hypothetical protein
VAGAQQAAVLSAELLQQHTLQQQQRYSNAQLPWLQQQQAVGAHAEPPPSGTAATPWQQSAAAAGGGGAPDAVLSPMLSELMSLGADVIDLEGSEADSDLLAVTPDRTCSKTAAAGAMLPLAEALEGISKQLSFDEAEGEPAAGSAVQDSSVGAGGSAHVQSVAASHVQHQQEVSGACINSDAGGPAASSAEGDGLVLRLKGGCGFEPYQEPDSVMEGFHVLRFEGGCGLEPYQEPDSVKDGFPVLRLKGGGGFEPHHGHGSVSGDDWQMGLEDSFDLADYDSSDDGGGSGSDDYWEAWELVQSPAHVAGDAGGSAAGAASVDSAAGSSSSQVAQASATGAVSASVAAGSSGSAPALQAAARRPSVPQGWLRALPPDWQVGAAPAHAYRVALRTSSKTGSGTKTRVSAVGAMHSIKQSSLACRVLDLRLVHCHCIGKL